MYDQTEEPLAQFWNVADLIAMTRAEAAAARRLGDPGSEAEALMSLSSLLDEAEHLPGALRAARRAVRLRRGLGDPVAHARALSVLGTALEHAGRLPEAVDCHCQALDLFRGADDGGGTRDELETLGHLLLGLDLHREALSAYLEALPFSEGDDSPRRGWLLRTVARLHHGFGQIPEALACLSEAMRLNPEEESGADHAILATLHLALGHTWEGRELLRYTGALYRGAGLLKEAEAVYEQARALAPRRPKSRLRLNAPGAGRHDC